ncbi:MAG: hypothetical protein AAFR90_02855 [Pseudomonadota bacterium]
MVKSIYNLEALRSACEGCPVTPGHAGLSTSLKQAAQELEFSFAFERAGWHRDGGVVLRDGTRITDNLRQWAEAEFSDIGPEINIPDNWGELLATRMDGRSVYFVASTGPRAWDFVQLEVEVVQEVVDRQLFPEDFVPDDIEEFLDPPCMQKMKAEPIGQARYHFRSVHHIAQLIEELDKNIGTNRRFARFLVDWENSSASRKARFCDNWLLRIFSYVDRFGEQKMEAAPFALSAAETIEHGDGVPSGVELGQAIAAIDHKAGYPMAWFFHMLTHQKHLHAIAEQVCRDNDVGHYAYLPEHDLEVVRAWYREPYCF